MNQFLHGVARAAVEAFAPPGPVLEVGSYQVAGQEALADLRPLFPGQSYTGVDLRAGPGVDCVASVEALPQSDGSVGTVLALNTFEHVARFWRGFEEIGRVLRPDGVLLVSCPFYFHIHNHPADYWRFTPAALDVLLEDYPQRVLGWHGPRSKPLHVWAVAFRAQRPPVTTAEYATYRMLLGQYARQPLAWTTRLRYGLGRLLCGRRPFLPYLEQNRWETECRPPAQPLAA
jgi:SAM-dependent methyltransferase